jgi:cysteine desulfurase family protein (TIGR01976 family)
VTTRREREAFETGTEAVEAVLPVDAIRAAFPALERRCAGHPVAYFDGPGGTQVPREVADAVYDYLVRHNANTGWAYPSSAETDAILEEARSAMADFLGCAPDEVAFGANMTTLTFHVSRAIGRSLPKDAEVVVTELDHHANIDPWREMARERDLEVRTVPLLPDTGTLDYERFEALLSPRTAVVAVGVASNALGTVNDLDRVASMVRERTDAILFVDAVHSAAHRLPDVRSPACDFLACSPYKFYGPHTGVLYGRRDRIEALDVPRLRPAHDTAPERLETGTLNHEGIAGIAAAVDFMAKLATEAGEERRRGTEEDAEGRRRTERGERGRPGEDIMPRRRALEATFRGLHARGEALFGLLWETLEEVPGVHLYGPRPGQPRTPTLAFTVDGVPSREVARRLADEWGVFCSHGDFYAATVVERLGLGEEGLVRAGCACYTTDEEIRRLAEGVRAIAEDVRG